MSLIQRQRRRIRSLYYEYRRAFWILVGVTFIDRLGGAMLFPFFALYITSKFNVGMTEVGVLFALFFVSSAIGSTLGCALTDRWGRKRMIIFSLLSSSLSTLLMGLVDTLSAFYVLALVSGIFTDTGGPAYEAMTADFLPESKRAEGFGIIRVALNLAVAVGPLIGGKLVATIGWRAVFLVNLPILAAAGVLVTRTTWRDEARPSIRAALFDVRLFAERGFASGAAFVALHNLTMYSLLFLVPSRLDHVVGGGPAETGRILLGLLGGMVVGSPIGGRVAALLGPRWTVHHSPFQTRHSIAVSGSQRMPVWAVMCT